MAARIAVNEPKLCAAAFDPTAMLLREGAGTDFLLLEQAKGIAGNVGHHHRHGRRVEIFRGSAPVMAAPLMSKDADPDRADPMLQAGRQAQVIDDLRKIAAEQIGHIDEAEPGIAGQHRAFLRQRRQAAPGQRRPVTAGDVIGRSAGMGNAERRAHVLPSSSFSSTGMMPSTITFAPASVGCSPSPCSSFVSAVPSAATIPAMKKG